jgi:hypothetical protein
MPSRVRLAHRFRGSGPDDGQLAALLNVQVNEWAVVEQVPS